MKRIQALWNRGLVGKVIISLAGLVIVCCVIGILVPRRPQQQGAAPAAAPPATSGAAAAAQPTEAPAATAGPTNTPQPTETPAPTPTTGPTDTPAPPSPTPEPVAQVRAAIEQALGKSNRKVDRVVTVALDPDAKEPQIYVRWSINDNVTEGLIKSAAQRDVAKVLRAVAESGVTYSGVLVEGLFPLVDKLGNSQEVIVVHGLYPRATIEKINWDNFLAKNVYDIASDINVHPLFQP